MAAAAILHFENLKNLTADTVRRVNLHHPAKFHRNRSSGCGEIAFFRFFKMAAVRHLGFAERMFWTTHEEYLVFFISVQNLVEIGAVVLIIRKFSYFAHLA